VQEKWQGDSAVDAQGRPVFLWEETAMVNAARQVKAARPGTSVIAWLDSTYSVECYIHHDANPSVYTCLGVFLCHMHSSG
jgi:hypothetical protein